MPWSLKKNSFACQNIISAVLNLKAKPYIRRQRDAKRKVIIQKSIIIEGAYEISGIISSVS